jgi:regulator of protease activity HflC (stomatin/prohibitin superfamily)
MSEPLNPSPTPPPGRTPLAPTSGAPLTTEDAGAQALSEAFRSSFQILKVLMVGLVLVYFFVSGIRVVKPNEVAVILRFGKPKGTGPDRMLKPDWYWTLPYPIDELVRIPVGQSHTVTSTTGWHALDPQDVAQNREPDPRGFLSPEADGYTLTAGANIIHVRATIKYRIQKTFRYEFGFADVKTILTNVVNDAIIYASAGATAQNAIYEDKIGFRDQVLARIQRKIEELDLGIVLEPSDVEVKAPADVRVAFTAANNAMQDRSTAVNTANGYYDEVTRKAKGEASAILDSGLVSSNRLVQSVTAEVEAFKAQLPYYKLNPRLFEQRLLAAAMQRVLTNAQEKFVLPDLPDGQARELRLQLSREPLKRESPERP